MDFAQTLFSIIEVLGTIAFALSGTLVGIDCGLDYLGVIVLGVTTAVGGGIIRDVLLGRFPPAAFVTSTYVIIAAIACAVAIWFAQKYTHHFTDASKVKKYLVLINIFDAMGLGMFTILGMDRAIAMGHLSNSFLVIFIGVMTGVGGGITRDVFVHRTPMILKKDIYATASLAGGLVYFFLYQRIDHIWAVFVSVSLVFIIRIISMYFDLNLPGFGREKPGGSDFF